MSLSESAYQYWVEPTRDRFMALRDEIVAAPNYAPYASFNEAAALVSAGDAGEAVRRLRALLPGAFLSPLLHRLLAQAYQRLGDQEAVAREARFAQAALEGIMLTGDGSHEHPYHVLRISDEYDVLAYLNERSAKQSLAREPERTLDSHVCASGREIWFDISAFFALAGKQ